MTDRRTLLGLAAALAVLPLPALAQEVVLKLHQFLPAEANVPAQILDVWADNVERDSDGRIKVDRYPSMQLGGTPPQLMDQAIDGVADVIWTVVGYTPGRFPRTEVFELPFMVSDAEAASAAFWQMFESDMQEEFTDVHLLGTWVHGQGLIHADREVRVPGDLRGVKVRGPSRTVNRMLETLGAVPVGMPVPAVPEALSRGVIDAATLPWEVTGSLKVPELVEHHTEFEGPMLYTLTFVLAMNKARYEGLPDDLKAVIDANSGLEFSVFAGRTQAAADAPARQAAVDAGNTVVTLSGPEAQVWRDAAQPVHEAWVAEMEAAGIDGQALIDRARGLMDGYGG
ncbi:TRAP transporter substrate-binding protein [Jannaschia rubra]|uniref:C4-dicarboxylate-binding periplasmic protein n=1 Tax=Jannaschia rubra TaxID=282197 RepID=A0A0M6XJJ2_9RHOB|nr:TRAP transporter substrate-binding protein [Jannaschia rubra]CTQ31326.1 C4-dicarboxylate-binding periplasmic protein precursor [Jannaschia rubra]SFF81607.1 TRAP-type C4-dicarboxylate transport system, substrate-binding protein [Jannaschia rubra]